MKIEKVDFGTTKEGTPVDLYVLTNSHGVVAKITNYGGIVTSLILPDKNGKMEDVVLGFDSLSGYLQDDVPYFGAIIGRYGNRIAGGKFSLDGQEYTLAQNNGPNTLHGGLKGFDKRVWQAEEMRSEDGVGVKMHYLSPDGEEGYPGNLSVDVVYTLTDNNELIIEYSATTDKPTVVNLTNHSYFNFTGNTKRDILDHKVMIKADKFVPVDEDLIPTGQLQDVKGTPMDFTNAARVGQSINADHEQIKLGRGYDHTWVLGEPGQMKLAATVYEPATGRYMETHTTEPGVQFYTGNFLNGQMVGKGGVTYDYRYGLCLETQHLPDSPNQPQFPSVALRPGETYSAKTVYKFAVK
ncbi:aldose epimerase family protein [Cesiribacter sp. SM1]|uniref:aldose epimerase family protein n=1 Tax=Cesiribacter sp. SM1 TaxID=2861196 RepID=UPI001CD7D99B|nr:aldose epimerase family protein [Cesiribacter sp. SM1]